MTVTPLVTIDPPQLERPPTLRQLLADLASPQILEMLPTR